MQWHVSSVFLGMSVFLEENRVCQSCCCCVSSLFSPSSSKQARFDDIMRKRETEKVLKHKTEVISVHVGAWREMREGLTADRQRQTLSLCPYSRKSCCLWPAVVSLYTSVQECFCVSAWEKMFDQTCQVVCISSSLLCVLNGAVQLVFGHKSSCDVPLFPLLCCLISDNCKLLRVAH